MTVILLTCSVLAVPPGVLIDRVVAVVDKEVITQSELLAEARLSLAMRGGEATAAADFEPEFIVSFRTYMIDQLLIAGEARRLGVAEVSEQEVDLAARKLEQQFKSSASYQAFLRRFGISSLTVRDVLRRDVRNDRFIRERMRLRLAGQSAANDARDARYQAALASWLEELQSGAEIRLANAEGELQLQKGPSIETKSTTWLK